MRIWLLGVGLLLTQLCLGQKSAVDYLEEGMLKFKEGLYKEAITAYTLGLGEDKKQAQLYANRGEAYFVLDNLNAARLDFTSAIKVASFPN